MAGHCLVFLKKKTQSYGRGRTAAVRTYPDKMPLIPLDGLPVAVVPATWPTPFSQEMTKKIEENVRLKKDATDVLACAEQAERDLEEQVQHNARLHESLESARLEVARCQEAVDAAEAKAARHGRVSAELEEDLRTLRGQVTAARKRLQALGDDLAKSNVRVEEAKARVREMIKVTYYCAYIRRCSGD